MINIDLSGKVVLVTGGSRGIGAACVKIFFEAGANVAFVFKNDNRSAEELQKLSNDNVLVKAYRADIFELKNIESVVKKIIADFGKIDVLVNNAGIWKHGKIDEMKIEDWNETITTNLTASFLFIKNVLPSMKKNNFGRIINISSTAGQRGEPEYSHYASSKGGMISLTKSLAVELAKYNITTNCVAPGWVYTDMTKDELSKNESKEFIKNYIPVGRAAFPEEIANAVLFLASNLANHINGEILNVNGGSVLCG